MKLAPIILIVYNRPLHTQKAIDSLLKNKYSSESNLFVFSDNAFLKSDKQKVQEVRSYIKTIKGFKKVTMIERERNWGMTNNIIDAVTQIVNQYSKVIVLEDDVLVHPLFIQYMNQSLEMYMYDNIVFGITGYLDPLKNKHIQNNTFFHRYPSCWGWGTWKRAWLKFDINLRAQIYLIHKNQELKRFSFNSANMILDQVKKNLSGYYFTYQIRWYASCFNQGGIFLHPAESLTTNIGFDGTGDRCGNDNTNITQQLFKGKELLLKRIPISEQISIRKQYENFYINLTYENNFKRKMKDIIKTFLSSGKKIYSFIIKLMSKIIKRFYYVLLHVIPTNVLINIVKKKIINKKIILTYHSFGIDSYFYSLNFNCFCEHLEILQKLNVNFCNTEQFLLHDDNQGKVLITFDDGYKSTLEAIEKLISKNINAVIFITTSFMDSNYRSYMTWNNLKQISKNSLIEIGSHCVHHVPLDSLNLYDVENELSVSKDTIQNEIQKKINILAYPFGCCNTEVKMLAKKFYDYACTSVESINRKNISSDPYRIMRLCLDKSHEWKKKFLLDIYLNAKGK